LQMKSIQYKLIIEYGKKRIHDHINMLARCKTIMGRLACHHYAKLGVQCELGFGL
jgi:hypothetical protein